MLLLLSFLFLLFHVRLFLRLMLLLLFLFLLFHVRLFLRCFCVLSCFCCCYCSCCLSFWLMLLLLFFVISRQIVLCCCCCCFFWCQIDVSSSEIRRPNWFRSFVANGGFRESKPSRVYFTLFFRFFSVRFFLASFTVWVSLWHLFWVAVFAVSVSYRSWLLLTSKRFLFFIAGHSASASRLNIYI